MNPVLLNILLPAFCPFLVACIVCGTLLAMGRKWPYMAQVASGIGASAGFACGFILVRGWPAFPPTDSTSWLLFGAIAGVIVTLPTNRWVRLISCAALACAVCYLVLKPVLASPENTSKAGLLIAGAAVISMALLFTLRQTGARASIWPAGMSVLISVIFVAVAAALSRAASFGQLTGAIASALGGTMAALFLVSARKPPVTQTEPAVLVTTALAAGMMAATGYFAKLPLGPGILLAISPLAAWASLLFVRKGKTLTWGHIILATLCAVILTALICLAALWWITKLVPPLESEYDY
jgi:hypothetical protein